MEIGQSMEKRKKKVMVAIDESECSRHALEWALEFLAGTISDSDLVIFTVQPHLDVSYVYASPYGASPMELINSTQDNQKNSALALLGQAKKLCAKRGVVPEMITDIGRPKEQICDLVEKLGVDLLVMGSHGRGAIQRAFLGSVSNYCVHNAKCPVLMVRKPT